MGMYCCCGVRKIDGWKCKCDWNGWYLCLKVHDYDSFPPNIPIKNHPDNDGTYEVRTFSDGDYDEEVSEFCLTEKNWGEPTNKSISHWKISYDDGWMGYRGVFAWKKMEQ